MTKTTITVKLTFAQIFDVAGALYTEARAQEDGADVAEKALAGSAEHSASFGHLPAALRAQAARNRELANTLKVAAYQAGDTRYRVVKE